MKKLFYLFFLLISLIAHSQNVGIGTTTPQKTLDVKGNFRSGGSNNFITHDSASGKITWSNSYLFVPAPQYIIKHSASAEGLYSNGAQLEYRDQLGAPAFFTNWTNGNGYFSGKLGIGVLPTTVPLSFSQSLGDKISLYSNSSVNYGFGIQPYLLQIHTDISAADISFGFGNSASFTENMRVKGNGNVGVGTSNPLSKLHVYGTESNPNGNAAAIQLSNVAAGSGLNNWFLRTGATGTNTPAGGFSIGDNTATRFVIDNSGKVGIGTLAPTGSVEIKSTDTYQLVLGNPNTNPIDYTRILLTTPTFFGGQGSWQISSIISLGLNYDKFLIADNSFGNVLSLSGDGNATLAGTLTQNSDLRLKRNIHPLENSLQKILQLNGYNYYWKNKNSDSSLQIGVVAQEMQKLFPELVKEDEKGILSVNYSGLIPVLIESVKEQQQQINELKKLVQQLLKK